MGGKGQKRADNSSRALIKHARLDRPSSAPSSPLPPSSSSAAAATASAAGQGHDQGPPTRTPVVTSESVDDHPEEDVAFDDGLERAPAGGGKRVIVVLDKACLEPVKAKSGKFELLNCDDHLALHKRLGKDPSDSRPDIAHQCLLSLLDSPLNKAGLLTVILRTESGVLVEVSPSVRIPRTFKRFAGLMVQLLHKLRIRAAEGSKTLLRVIKNPVTDHLPVNCRKFAMSTKGALVDINEFAKHLPDDDSPIVFVFGAMARGHVDPDYVENFLSVSQYALSGSVAISRVLSAFERKWNIV